MNKKFTRRSFALASTGVLLGSAAALADDEEGKTDAAKKKRQPVEAVFERDYPVPKFRPGWKNPQINRTLVEDFVIYAHNDLPMVEKLLKREKTLVRAAIDWGAGDYETALGGASHMGRKDIVKVLLKHGARIDIFCAAMMGMVDVVKAFLTLEPAMIDAPGPHGFTLHWHAQMGFDEAKPVLDYLQSVKEIELKPIPPMMRPKMDKKK